MTALLSQCLQWLLWSWQRGRGGAGLAPCLPESPRGAVRALQGLPGFSAACFRRCTGMVVGAPGRAGSPPLWVGASCMLSSAELFRGSLTPLQCALLVWLWGRGRNSPLGWDLKQQPPLPSPAEPWGCQELPALRGEPLPSQWYRGSHPDESCWLRHLLVPPLRVSQGFSWYGTSCRGEVGAN